MNSKIPFSKRYSDPKSLVLLLQSRGMIIEDLSFAESYIRNIGYYRLSAYMYPFLKVPKLNHIYKENTSFNNVLRLYAFDKKLRLLIFNEIEKIEIAVRTKIVNAACETFQDPFWMTDSANFTNLKQHVQTVKLIDDALKKSKEDFIVHFRNTYQECYPPAWMLSEILPFGILTRIYSNLKNKRVKKIAAQSFGLQAAPFESWLTTVTLVRNSCCHHARVWNKQNTITPMMPKNPQYPWITKETSALRIYFDLCIIKYLLNAISPQNDLTTKIKDLLSKYPEINPAAMGFPKNWEEEPVWQ